MRNIFFENIEKLNFFNFPTRKEAANFIITDWQKSKKSMVVNYIYYSNYVLLRKHNEYARAILLSNYLLSDGIGMEIYFKKVIGKKITNLNGTDLNPLFLRELKERNIPIALYGTTRDNIECCTKKLLNQNINIYYYHDGFSPLNWGLIKPNSALFVGLGTPKQEIWVQDNWDKILTQNLLIVTVGGFFDFCSGFYKKAPHYLINLHLEWLWRLMLNPIRHYKKNMRNLTIFYYLFADTLNPRIKKLTIKKGGYKRFGTKLHIF